MKRRINKKRLLILIIIVLGILNIGIFTLLNFMVVKIDYQDKKVSVNTTFKVSDYIKKIRNGKVINGDEQITVNELGKKEITIKYQNRFGMKKKTILTLEVIDDIAPKLTAPSKITIVEGDGDDFLQYVTIEDNYDDEPKIIINGDYSRDKAGEYKLEFVGKDQSNNETKVPFTLEVTQKKKVVANQNKSAYYVKVNKTHNVAIVYGKDSNGEYTKIVKTFLVSTGGDNTPNGNWTTTDRYETLSLVGGVWGHYTLRIEGPIWFHSVPYYSKPKDGHWNDLEYEEFNKLGTSASLGCVRLSSLDAKWIFDNLPWHTEVEIYESDELPDGVVKPTGVKIDVTSENKGWDPTDPDPDNPWNL